MVFVVGLVGVIIGALAAWAWAQRRLQVARGAESDARRDVAVREVELTQAREELSRVLAEHEATLSNLGVTFESLSNRVLASQLDTFSRSQAEIQKERDDKLGLALKPLTDLLGEYKTSLDAFGREHQDALVDVRQRAKELLEAQQRTQEETGRLNQILGRSDQRGRWGEVQLANVLERSGLREGIDYTTQVTTTSESRVSRPDCVVNAPGGWRLALDAKFPFDSFERALSSTEPSERRALFLEHARALRSHVRALGQKAYWEGIVPAPQFVVCFVPSDYAISAALEADPELIDYAGAQRVLISGPTNLLGLLWSVAAVVRQHSAVVNQERLLKRAGQIYERLAKVFEPVAKVGESLNRSVEQYNRMVRSLESRLLPAARDLREYGAASEELPELSELGHQAVEPNAGLWGGEVSELEAGAGDVVDAEIDEA